MNKDEDGFLGDLSLLDVLEIICKPPVLDKVLNDDFDHILDAVCLLFYLAACINTQADAKTET